MAIKQAVLSAGRGGAAVTGYGGVGYLIAKIAEHKWPWIDGEAVLIAVTSILHTLQSGWAAWLAAKRETTPTIKPPPGT